MRLFFLLFVFVFFNNILFAQGDELNIFVSTLIGPNSSVTDDIVIDNDGNLYVNDALGSGTLNNPKGTMLIRISPQLEVDTFAIGLDLPLGNTIDAEGNIYVANYFGGTVDIINSSGEHSTIVSGLTGICDVVKDSNENLYVTRSGESEILKIDAIGNVSVFFKGWPLEGCIGLTIDENDNLYVANFINAKVHKIAIPNPSKTELVATVGNFNTSGALGFIKYKNGYLYCPGYANSKIYKVDVNDGTVTLLAGTGVPGRVDGSREEAQFYQPNGIAITSTGDTLYVTDDVDRTLRMIVINHQATSIKENSMDQFSFKLHQNYPNPFNPCTIINYSLQHNTHVQLKVYDCLGCEVAVLVNKEQSTGHYNVEFNARDLSSGIYYYRLETGDYNDIKKFILLR